MSQYNCWMYECFLKQGKDPLLCSVKMIGTHNSGINKKVINTKIGGYNNDTSVHRRLNSLAKIIPPVVTGWTVCQKASIIDQLRMGVRYLDVRVSLIGGEVVVTHTFGGPTLESVLTEIHEFYKEYAPRLNSEVVTISIKPDYEHRGKWSGNIPKLFDCIANHSISDIVIPVQDENVYTTKLSKFRGTPVIIATPAGGIFSVTTPHLIHELEYEDDWWANTDDKTKLFKNIDKCLSEIGKTQRFSAVQAILTPQSDTIIKSVVSGATIAVLVIVCLVMSSVLALKRPFSKVLLATLVGFVVLTVSLTISLIMWGPAASIRGLSKGLMPKILSNVTDKSYNVILIDYVDTEFCKSVIRQNMHIE